jgi:hypothetical protein
MKTVSTAGTAIPCSKMKRTNQIRTFSAHRPVPKTDSDRKKTVERNWLSKYIGSNCLGAQWNERGCSGLFKIEQHFSGNI